MIDLYTWGTPNGRKVSIMLEELSLDYRVHAVDILNDEQFSDQFTAINPNRKIPAIVDSHGAEGAPVTVFESGAILIYLAEKHPGPLLPTHGPARYQVLQWLMLQMGGVGPMFGQVHHFMRFASEDVPYAKKRYQVETQRLYGVLDERLAAVPYLAGEDYSIADIATYPWVARNVWQEIELGEYPAVKRWLEKLSARPGVEKGMAVPET